MAEDIATVDAPEAETDEKTALEATVARPGGADKEEQQAVLSPESARKLQSEAKTLRERLKATEEELRQRKNAELSDQQRLESDYETAKSRLGALEESNRALRVRLAAKNLGISDDVAAYKLLDTDSVDDWDDDKAITRALRELGKRHPALLGVSEGVDAGAHGAAVVNGMDMNALLRRAAGRT